MSTTETTDPTPEELEAAAEFAAVVDRVAAAIASADRNTVIAVGNPAAGTFRAHAIAAMEELERILDEGETDHGPFDGAPVVAEVVTAEPEEGLSTEADLQAMAEAAGLESAEPEPAPKPKRK